MLARSEGRRSALRRWDDGDDSVPDNEVTRDTRDGWKVALHAAKMQFADKAEWTTIGSELRILTPYGYVAVVRGQFTATGGLQGTHPDNIRAYDDIDVPVWLLYVERGARTHYHGFRHVLGATQAISLAKGPGARCGWKVRKNPGPYEEVLARVEGPIVFPTAIPAAPENRLFAV